MSVFSTIQRGDYMLNNGHKYLVAPTAGNRITICYEKGTYVTTWEQDTFDAVVRDGYWTYHRSKIGLPEGI